MRYLAGAALALGMAYGTTLLAQLPTFTAEVELATFGVTVADRRGTFLTDLTAEDFEVVEDGKRQTLALFARGDQGETVPELHIGLLFDTSGSMGQDIQLARSAAIRFLNTLPDAKDMTLVDFDTEVRVARYGQPDFPRMVERIRSRTPRGMTAMYDAMGLYLDGASEDEGRTILVLFTDGGDTRSALGFGDLMTLVRASDVTVYAIGFLNNQSGTARLDQRGKLNQLAEATGGQAFFPTTMKEVQGHYDTILAQIRAQYSLGYASTNTAADGQWRKVEITIKRPGLEGLRVQTRKGYFAPYRPTGAATPRR
jgi:Ca-activated chloride channel family protein